MRLTDFIIDSGRSISFSPGMRSITGSIAATLFLCQFIYWTGKQSDRDGWIYKTADEIEEETSLTYEEQKTARAKLVSRGFIEERYKRLDHKMYFRVNLDAISSEWELTHERGNATLPNKGKPSSADGDCHLSEQGISSFGNEASTYSLNRITEITTETTTERREESPAALEEISDPFVVNSRQPAIVQAQPEYSLIKIFCDVTGMVSIPGGEMEKTLPALERLKGKYSNRAELTEYLRGFYKPFKQKYPRNTRCFWLYDWAISGIVPEQASQARVPSAPAKNGGAKPRTKIYTSADGTETLELPI